MLNTISLNKNVNLYFSHGSILQGRMKSQNHQVRKAGFVSRSTAKKFGICSFQKKGLLKRNLERVAVPSLLQRVLPFTAVTNSSVQPKCIRLISIILLVQRSDYGQSSKKSVYINDRITKVCIKKNMVGMCVEFSLKLISFTTTITKFKTLTLRESNPLIILYNLKNQIIN